MLLFHRCTPTGLSVGSREDKVLEPVEHEVVERARCFLKMCRKAPRWTTSPCLDIPYQMDVLTVEVLFYFWAGTPNARADVCPIATDCRVTLSHLCPVNHVSSSWGGLGSVNFLLLPCSSLFLFSLMPSGFLFSCALTSLSCSSLLPLAALVANPAVSGLFCLSRSVVLPPAYAENINT